VCVFCVLPHSTFWLVLTRRSFVMCVSDGWDVSVRRLQALDLLPPMYLSPVITRVKNAGVEGINVNAQVYARMGLGLIRLLQPAPDFHRTAWPAVIPIQVRPGSDATDTASHELPPSVKHKHIASFSGRC
jgi:hypothetical protein